MDGTELRRHLLAGQVIPAHPLALTADRRLDERSQRALTRYYLAAGAGGLAVGVHTTQFEIRDHGILDEVLVLAAATVRAEAGRPVAMIAGAIGPTTQAVREAGAARERGYDAVLLSLGALDDAGDDALIAHCRAVADVMPLFGFYLQPAVGGRPLGESFWRRFVAIDGVVAIKIAPFDRYRTLDVIRALAASGRADIALYTGNDDSIVTDLLTPWRVALPDGRAAVSRIAGGLLGHWAIWTRRAVEYHRDAIDRPDSRTAGEWLSLASAVTEMNAAVFDPGNGFRGCLPGVAEVLRRQRLVPSTACLDPARRLSPGQLEAIDRVTGAFPELTDDAFVVEHLDAWRD